MVFFFFIIIFRRNINWIYYVDWIYLLSCLINGRFQNKGEGGGEGLFTINHQPFMDLQEVPREGVESLSLCRLSSLDCLVSKLSWSCKLSVWAELRGKLPLVARLGSASFHPIRPGGISKLSSV